MDGVNKQSDLWKQQQVKQYQRVQEGKCAGPGWNDKSFTIVKLNKSKECDSIFYGLRTW